MVRVWETVWQKGHKAQRNGREVASLLDIQRADGWTRQQSGLAGHVTLRKSLNLLGLSGLSQSIRDHEASSRASDWEDVRYRPQPHAYT